MAWLLVCIVCSFVVVGLVIAVDLWVFGVMLRLGVYLFIVCLCWFY